MKISNYTLSFILLLFQKKLSHYKQQIVPKVEKDATCQFTRYHQCSHFVLFLSVMSLVSSEMIGCICKNIVQEWLPTECVGDRFNLMAWMLWSCTIEATVLQKFSFRNLPWEKHYTYSDQGSVNFVFILPNKSSHGRSPALKNGGKVIFLSNFSFLTYTAFKKCIFGI